MTGTSQPTKPRTLAFRSLPTCLPATSKRSPSLQAGRWQTLYLFLTVLFCVLMGLRQVLTFLFIDFIDINANDTGTAGYGNTSWAIGMSFADNPVTQPAIYNPAATKGQRWSSEGLSTSTVNRMYHSSAVLLPDGLCLVPSPTSAFSDLLVHRFCSSRRL